MIKYNNIIYEDFISLLYDKLKKGQYVDARIFPTHTAIYCRAALQNKFKRKFKLKEVKELLQEMPHTSPTIKDDIEKLMLRHA